MKCTFVKENGKVCGATLRSDNKSGKCDSHSVPGDRSKPLYEDLAGKLPNLPGSHNFPHGKRTPVVLPRS